MSQGTDTKGWFGRYDSTGRLVYGAKDLRNFLPPGFPEIVCLAGSVRFNYTVGRMYTTFSAQGKIVLVPWWNEQQMPDGWVDETFLRKIDISDLLFVVNDFRLWCPNCCKWLNGPMDCHCMCRAEKLPYIGQHTQSEIDYAVGKNKRIEYLNLPVPVFIKEENQS
jgi:hypothetical protein